MSSLAEWNSARPGAVAPRSLLDRFVVILAAAKAAEGPIGVTELARRTALPKSTVSRLVCALVDQRYLERTTDGVRLGLRLFELGARASIPRGYIAAAAPVIRELAAVTGDRVGFWVHDQTEMVSIAAVPGRLPMLSTRAGMRSPALTTASGKAYLAFCEDAAVVDRVSAPLARQAAHAFRDELGVVRDRAIAIDPGDAYPGITAVASPLLAGGRVMGALSIAGPSGATDADRLAPLVRAASVALTRRLAMA